MDNLKKVGGLGLLLNPFSLTTTLIILVVAFVLATGIGILSMLGSSSPDPEIGGGFACQPNGKLNMDTWNAQFKNAGAFTGKGDDFLAAAEKNKIDPVLLASIAFHETGKGSSKMVRERNNPGGLYNSSAGTFFVYPTLLDGIDAMAGNLYRLYISKGLVTIEQIGAKYAPIGVANDPTNLNIHWVPNVSKMIAQFGGVVTNCTAIGFESGFASPMPSMSITSHFGFRIHPITGVPKLHAGIDYACTPGSPISAAMSGKVEKSTFMAGGWGNYVKINHGDKSTLYAHMTERMAKLGDTVKQGQVIGTCGTTGASTGPHLHLELYVGGTQIDPLPYFSNAGGKK